MALSSSREHPPQLAFAFSRGWLRVWRVISRDLLSLFSLTVIGLFVLVALFAPLLAPYPAQGLGRSNPATAMQPPSLEHPFGTDRLGRDMLSRVIMAARSALLVPLLVVALAVLIGAPLGALAGYFGGWLDEAIMRVTDLFLAFPSLLLAMAISAALGRGSENAALALALSWWPWYARLVRSTAASVRAQPYIEAARAIGLPEWRIIVRHVLPNCITPIVVQASIDIGSVILALGGLSFLGLGTQPPAPDWGLLVSEGRTFILKQWWLSTYPGLTIFVVVLAFNLLGDLLRDTFDPRQYR
jgi:peptide/nickel transport system permease protein